MLPEANFRILAALARPVRVPGKLRRRRKQLANCPRSLRLCGEGLPKIETAKTSSSLFVPQRVRGPLERLYTLEQVLKSHRSVLSRYTNDSHIDTCNYMDRDQFP